MKRKTRERLSDFLLKAGSILLLAGWLFPSGLQRLAYAWGYLEPGAPIVGAWRLIVTLPSLLILPALIALALGLVLALPTLPRWASWKNRGEFSASLLRLGSATLFLGTFFGIFLFSQSPYALSPYPARDWYLQLWSIPACGPVLLAFGLVNALPRRYSMLGTAVLLLAGSIVFFDAMQMAIRFANLPIVKAQLLALWLVGNAVGIYSLTFDRKGRTLLMLAVLAVLLLVGLPWMS